MCAALQNMLVSFGDSWSGDDGTHGEARDEELAEDEGASFAADDRDEDDEEDSCTSQMTSCFQTRECIVHWNLPLLTSMLHSSTHRCIFIPWLGASLLLICLFTRASRSVLLSQTGSSSNGRLRFCARARGRVLVSDLALRLEVLHCSVHARGVVLTWAGRNSLQLCCLTLICESPFVDCSPITVDLDAPTSALSQAVFISMTLTHSVHPQLVLFVECPQCRRSARFALRMTPRCECNQDS